MTNQELIKALSKGKKLDNFPAKYILHMIKGDPIYISYHDEKLDNTGFAKFLRDHCNIVEGENGFSVFSHYVLN